jgi:hypothetical protein
LNHHDSVEVGGSFFRIDILSEPDNPRRKIVTCIRLDSRHSRTKEHKTQIAFPQPILDHFKNVSDIGISYECRTEVVIDGTRYRAHPDFCSNGPWYDFALVQFDFELGEDSIYVNEDGKYPAKLVAFYRPIQESDGEHDGEYHVLAHCCAYQKINSTLYARKTLLVRPWFYEISGNNRPLLTTIGTTRSDVSVLKQLFAIEEKPGIHDLYPPTDLAKRTIHVILDMRKEWPLSFINNLV